MCQAEAMCCQNDEAFDLPADAIEALARYRRMLAERGPDWGNEEVEFSRWAGFPLIAEAMAAWRTDWASAVRTAVADPLPAGVVVVRVDPRERVTVTAGPPVSVLGNGKATVHVVVDAEVDAAPVIDGAAVTVHSGAIERIVVTAGPDLTVDGHTVTVGVARPEAALRLTSGRCARWSVRSDDGAAWFPPGVPQKWDYHGRPFFHGHDVTVRVPAGDLTVRCGRGLEFDTVERRVTVDPGETKGVDVDPPRRFDPPAAGWYGGDLHVHLNYSGDMVIEPADAARMQHGEGLHLMNLVAGNFTSSLIYDRDLFERTAGTDLPWSDHHHKARMGVEYRNDLLGHVHALGPTRPPTRYQAGHERSDHTDDWPPNAVACAELRDAGATVGYAHPAGDTFPDDWSTDRFFANPRSVEARELVADAALGLVDSVDVISPFDHEGSAFLYHRLLSCGLRLAATAGTDVFLSFSRSPLASNPPGWGRVYARVGGDALSVDSFQNAVRAGRTMVTNGPWLTLDVDGHGPGTVLDRPDGSRLTVTVTTQGPGVERLTIVGADGVHLEKTGERELRAELTLDGPTWIAAVARGGEHPDTLDAGVFAHTSPVFLDVAGERVARRADARWCLDLLDRLQAFVAEHGHFAPATRDDRLADLVAVLDDARRYYRGVEERAPR
jgi:hypothetical protein